MTTNTKPETKKEFLVTDGNIAFDADGKKLAGEVISLSAAEAKPLKDAGIIE